ncbi:amino acid/amide ABC transporter membrane protein 2 (HAAT family) [Advenella incenata]|uniref:Amino acid/amide ABC transporter membrane protein 2 (HAAT family) n=1 Tax=Advenella incenata TaxID=267800 RepID=A0A4Q7VFU5_9BURK|nr:branched-chain amino acid ABC transporter permease [Advenella incenata]RZT94867.1 amino acid/amide ABC transporter membrane protein 2 (HAAT family) [Advenella incenata]
MTNFFSIYETQFQLFLIGVGFAYSQQIVLRAGLFSIATAGFASIGAYATAITVTNYGVHPTLAIGIAVAFGGLAGAMLSIPLVRLRGVYQAIATLAFVQVVMAFAFYAEPLTGGALGINRIPQVVKTWHLLLAVGVTIYLTFSIAHSGIGRAFNAIRQNEVVAATLGVSILRYQIIAFVISGLMGGLFGGLFALQSYSVTPEHFGFAFLTTVLAYIVLGGRNSFLGPLVGCAILSALPEIARPLSEYRVLLQGALMIIVMNYMPMGVVDTLLTVARRSRMTDHNNHTKVPEL